MQGHQEASFDSKSLAVSEQTSIWHSLLQDQKNFYSPDSLALLSGGFIVGGLMANTVLDRTFNRHFQQSVRRASSDEWFEKLHASKELGNGRYSLPVFILAISTRYLPENTFSDSMQLASTWGGTFLTRFHPGCTTHVGDATGCGGIETRRIGIAFISLATVC